jgi:hypothetical protein
MVSGDRGGVGFGIDLVCQEYNPNIWDWSTSDEWTLETVPNTNLPGLRFANPPSALSGLSDQTTLLPLPEGVFLPRILATWPKSPDVFVRSGGHYEIEHKAVADADWIPLGKTILGEEEAHLFVVESQVTGQAYHIRIRAVNVAGGLSGWVVSPDFVLQGDNVPPALPTEFTASPMVNGAALAWTNPPDIDFDSVLIFRNTINDSAGAVLVNNSSSGAYSDSGLSSTVTYYYWLKSIDKSGHISETFTGAQSVTPHAPPFALTVGWGDITGQPTDEELLNAFQQWSSVIGDNRPEDNATYNGISRLPTAPVGPYPIGHLWYATDDDIFYWWSGPTWEVIGNGFTDTNQLSDGAQLGATAIWSGVSGSGRPEDNATVGASWDSNLEAIPERFSDDPPTEPGLFSTDNYFGYYDGTEWTSYIRDNGYFFFKGDDDNLIQWDGSILQVKGSLQAGTGLGSCQIDVGGSNEFEFGNLGSYPHLVMRDFSSGGADAITLEVESYDSSSGLWGGFTVTADRNTLVGDAYGEAYFANCPVILTDGTGLNIRNGNPLISLSGTSDGIINFHYTTTNDDRGILFNYRPALTADSSDGFLRINQGGSFSNGVIIDGPVIVGSADGTGSNRYRVGSSGNHIWSIGAGIDMRLTDTRLGPEVDNGLNLAAPNFRFQDAYITDGVTTGSTRSLKKNIRPLHLDAVDFLTTIQPRTFKWEEGSRDHTSYIAEDIRDYLAAKGIDWGGYIDPAEKGDSDGPLSIRPHEFIAILHAGWAAHEKRLLQLEATHHA